jgi:hypothetical protein
MPAQLQMPLPGLDVPLGSLSLPNSSLPEAGPLLPLQSPEAAQEMAAIVCHERVGLFHGNQSVCGLSPSFIFKSSLMHSE